MVRMNLVLDNGRTGMTVTLVGDVSDTTAAILRAVNGKNSNNGGQEVAWVVCRFLGLRPAPLDWLEMIMRLESTTGFRRVVRREPEVETVEFKVF
jgi:hypothetical protein